MRLRGHYNVIATDKSALFPYIESAYKERRRKQISSSDALTSRSFHKNLLDIDRVPDTQYLTSDERIEYRSVKRAQLKIVKTIARTFFTGSYRVVADCLLHTAHPIDEVARLLKIRKQQAGCRVRYVKWLLIEMVSYYNKRNYKVVDRFFKETLSDSVYRTLFLYLRCRSLLVVGKTIGVVHTTVMRRLLKVDNLMRKMLHVEEIRDFFVVWRRIIKLYAHRANRSNRYGKQAFDKFGTRFVKKGERAAHRRDVRQR
jgi:hypothetical protein